MRGRTVGQAAYCPVHCYSWQESGLGGQAFSNVAAVARRKGPCFLPLQGLL